MVMVAGLENLFASNGAEAMYEITQYLIDTVGWTLISENDGLGGAITGFNTGANGYDNSLASRFLADPGGGTAVSFQRNSANNTQWRVIVSRGGSTLVAATTTQAAYYSNATLSWNQIGGGVPASPTFENTFPAGAFMLHCAGDNADMGGGVYPFWWFGHASGTANVQWSFILDGFDQRHPTDTQPIMVYSRYSNDFNAARTGFSPYGLTWTSNLTNHPTYDGKLTYVSMVTGTPQTGFLVGTSRQGTEWLWEPDQAVPPIPIYVAATNAAPRGLKGRLGTWRIIPSYLPSLGDTIGLATADAWLIVKGASGNTNSTAVRWPQNAVFQMSP